MESRAESPTRVATWLRGVVSRGILTVGTFGIPLADRPNPRHQPSARLPRCVRRSATRPSRRQGVGTDDVEGEPCVAPRGACAVPCRPVLWLEREVANALIDEYALVDETDPRRRATILRYVEDSLHAIPVHIRLGMVGVSLVLSVRPCLLSMLGRFDREHARASVRRWEKSRIGLIYQYMHGIRSIVLLVAGELP